MSNSTIIQKWEGERSVTSLITFILLLCTPPSPIHLDVALFWQSVEWFFSFFFYRRRMMKKGGVIYMPSLLSKALNLSHLITHIPRVANGPCLSSPGTARAWHGRTVPSARHTCQGLGPGTARADEPGRASLFLLKKF